MIDSNIKFQVLLILLLYSFTLFAQCPLALSLKTQQDVDNFILNYPNCTTIKSGVNIGVVGVNEPRSNINDLTPLSNLRRINGDLILWQLDSLERIDGLDSLEFVGKSLWLSWNSRLKNLDNFGNLDSIGALVIHSNDSLIEFNGLRNMKYIQGSVDIALNKNLASISGLENIAIVNGDLNIHRSPLLMNLVGLNNISEVKGNLSLRKLGINSLTEFEDMKNVKGDLLINENLNLIDLFGLENVDSIGGDFELMQNITLSDCKAICKLLTLGHIGGVVTINSNDAGCGSIQNIVNQHCSSVISDKGTTASLIKVFPNPITSHINIITKNENYNSLQVDLVNSLGVIVLSKSYSDLESLTKLQIDVSQLSPGMYFILAGNKYLWSTKTIIIAN